MIGSLIGVVAKLIVAMIFKTRPNKKTINPTANHIVPSLSGRKMEYAVDKSHNGIDKRLAIFYV